jgi:histidinol-phosphate aminotransferase
VEIDLSDSTNQWGVAPSALSALRDWSPRMVSEYPPVESLQLAKACAEYVGVAPENVISGCGSDNLLDAAMRAFAEPGERVAHPSPSFAMIPVSARTNGLTPVAVPVLPNGDVDAEGMLATGARIIYLCTPNNPTGTAHSRAAVERVIAEAPGVVIIDEAYAEFADTCHTASAPRHPHVFATRTLSKCFGLAGLRVGYGVGSPSLINEVLKARGPYKVNAFAERAATAALANDRAWIAELVASARDMRARFASALRSIGLSPLPSQANFLCVPVANARATVDRLYGFGIAVRGFPDLPGIGDALRIGLAPWPVLERVCDALRSSLA